VRQSPVTQKELDRLHTAWESSPESRSFAPLADAYHRAGRNEEAIELLNSGTARHPDYLSAQVLLANCYQALGRSAEADAIFNRVLSQDAENICALENQAARSIQQGALGNAAALVQQLRQLDPWDATIQALAMQLEQAPRSVELPDARTSVQQAPRGPIRSVEDTVYRGAPAASTESSSARAALPEGTRDELSTLTLAQIYESQGYLQKALTIYDELAQQHPENTQIAQHLEELRRRLLGVDESAQTPGAAATEQTSESVTPGWRLVDAQALESLQPASSLEPTAPQSAPAARQLPPADQGFAQGETAAPLAAPPGAGAAARDEDFQRFLRYVRSLGR
jgi:tetratricopeptide (TPR) repeat protein